MATSLDLTDEQLEVYISTARRQSIQKSAKHDSETREAVLARVRLAAQSLYTEYGATRVILFGSLAHEAWFAPDSDVDLLVMGIGNDYWRAWEAVEEIIGDRSVDLIDWEMASESLRRVVSDEGIVL